MDVDNLLESRHFCILPFTRQTLWYDGNYKLCCHTGGLDIDQDTNNVRSFNSEQYQRIRQAFVNNEFPAECQGCQRLTEQNLTSPGYAETQGWLSDPDKRQQAVKVIEKFQAGDNLLPQMLDIRYSNVCNLKCRTCNPANSSAIQAEYQRIPEQQRDKKFYVGPIKQKYNHTFPAVDEHLFRLYFAGGEPLIEQYNLDFLEQWQDCDTDVIINTNLTVLNDKILNLLAKFKHISLIVSIDGTGTVNDYIRNGSKFDIVIKNLDTVYNMSNMDITINTVLNMYNIFNIDDLVLFVKEKYPRVFSKLSIQPVVVEEELFLDCLPTELRPEALTHLKTALTHSPENINVLQDSIRVVESNQFNQLGFEQFIKYAHMYDNMRGESLPDIVPQYQPYY